ncbi:zf-HC2 domain-containing protein [Paenibacillus caui]|uniref:zf-HC2 domain-containing protein n=1 Tax=Paenibacillus caui TaxID=2873927 RepID=UPI001F3A5356|nr:zf-HC2 domain-containing protein [Paenibacillus caui]
MFGWIWDLPESHPERKRLEWHMRGCEDCSEQFEIWQESLNLVHSLPVEVCEERAEAVNRKVMDRIYAESPWLAPGKETASERLFRKRLMIWAAGFMSVFLISVILYAFSGPLSSKSDETMGSGLIPTAVAGTESVSGSHMRYNLTNVSSGIVDPYVVGMNPVHPLYWMVLSMVAMGLALLAWRGLRRVRHH